ncbi:MAG: hypothetical protein AAGD86_02360, partial [Pseudomonadota bacterium]
MSDAFDKAAATAAEDAGLAVSGWRKLRQDAAVVSAGLVLFLLVMYVLVEALFPAGTRLGESLGTPGGVGDARTADSRRVSLEARRLSADAGIAAIDTVRRQVRFRPSDSLVWSDAIPGDTLFDRDSVQTLEGSGAVIRFNEGSELAVGERSIVVL